MIVNGILINQGSGTFVLDPFYEDLARDLTFRLEIYKTSFVQPSSSGIFLSSPTLLLSTLALT